MIRHSHKLLLAAVLSGFSAISTGSIEAGCHGHSSGGYSGGRSYSSNYSYGPSYSQPVYAQPVYRQPVYPQPTYPQPLYQQPVYAQGGYGQPPAVFGQPQPQNFPQSQQLQQPQFQAQPQTMQQPQMQGGVAMTGTVGSNNLASGQQQLPQPQVQMQQPQPQVQVQPQQQLQAGTAQAAQPQAFAPQNAAPALTAPVQSPTGVAPHGNLAGSPAPENSAQQSALQALGGFAPPQNAAAQSAIALPQTPQSTFTGAWTASLSNGARVQLSLQADGNFSWVAVNKDGQASSFQGTYSMENGSLSLSRNTDGQKLTGSLTPSGANNFSFKLSDAQASSLDFVRG